MTILLNNTLLSNFSVIARPDLVQVAFESELVATTEAVMAEHNKGVAEGHLPECDWSWVKLLTMTQAEQGDFDQFSRQLGKGESACLTLAKTRGMKFATDDWDARRRGQRLGIPITGTIGVLAILVKDEKLNFAEADVLLHQMIRAGFHAPVKSVKEILTT